MLLAGGGGFWAGYAESGYSILLLIVAGLLVRRARELSYQNSFLLSIAVGVSLLFRSVLVLLPLLLAISEWRRRPPTAVGSRWKHALILCVVPYLFLIPWVGMNWALQHRFVLFENGAANGNIALGALGVVVSTDVDWRRIFDSADPQGAQTVWSWATGEICRHPLRYLKGFAGRAGFAAALHPWLFLAAFLALGIHRKKREFQVLGLLVLYYVGIYCSMAVTPIYFYPLWPVLAVLAVCGPFALMKSKAFFSEQRLSSGYAVVAFLAVASACALYAEAKVVLYPSAIAQAPDAVAKRLDDAILSRPQDAWLLFERGKRRLDEGKIPEAISDLSRAEAAGPIGPECGLRLAWARMLRGDPASLLRWPIPPDVRGDGLDVVAHLYKAHAFIRMGRTAAARQELTAARESELLVTGSASPKPFIENAAMLFRHRPGQERLSMLGELEKWAPRDATPPLLRARLLLEMGRPREALASLKRAEALSPADQVMSWMPGFYRAFKEPGQVLALTEDLFKKQAGDAALYIERAEKSADLGRRGEARASLRRAEERGPSEPERRRIALMHQSLGDCVRALAIWEGLARQAPLPAKDLSDKAVCEYLSGRREEAVSDLLRAIELSPSGQEAYLSLGAIYAGGGFYGKALDVYGRALTFETPPAKSPIRQQIVDARDMLRRKAAIKRL